MDKWGNFPLLPASLSLFIIWTGVERSGKIPRAPAWRWGEWIWLTGPSGLHRNSPQGINISSIRVFAQIRDPEIRTSLYQCVESILKYAASTIACSDDQRACHLGRKCRSYTIVCTSAVPCVQLQKHVNLRKSIKWIIRACFSNCGPWLGPRWSSKFSKKNLYL